jgi:hypothetical protein
MKFKNKRKIREDAVFQSLEAEFEVSQKELKELADALAIIEKWKGVTRAVLSINEANADYTLYKFDMDNALVKVICEQGANG